MIIISIFRKWRLHKKHELHIESHKETLHPGVSILKPMVSSEDPFLFSNLETFFTLTYPGKVQIYIQIIIG